MALGQRFRIAARQDADINGGGAFRCSAQTPAQENDHAPYISGKCVRIVQSGKGVSDAYKRIQNDCAMPVAVTFCLEAPGPINQCLNPSGMASATSYPPKSPN